MSAGGSPTEVSSPLRTALAFAISVLALAGFVTVAIVANPQERRSTIGELAGPLPTGRQGASLLGDRGKTDSLRDVVARVRPTPTPTPTRTRSSRPPSHAQLTAPPEYYVRGKSVALTFDDGPDPRWTPQILDLLRTHHVRATFCLIGRQAKAHPELVRRIVAEGHALCNHTWDHDERLPKASTAHVVQEIQDGYNAIVAASGGVRPVYFRAPGGAWSPVVLAKARERGMRPLAWSIDPRDWTRPGTARIVQGVLAARPGNIILCHDGGGNRSETVAATAQVLPALRHRGLTFVLP